jgi:glycosyltransferase involved in cell wall biosynthesis
MPTVVIEGWRLLPHSYSLWAQYLALDLLDRPGIEVFFRDAAMPDARWTPRPGVLSAQQEQRLAGIPAPPEGLAPDLLARIVFPYDFSPSTARRTLVFGTAEYGIVPTTFVKGGVPIAKAVAESGHTAVTCTKWSTQGFLRSGVKSKQMGTVICAVDPAVFHPVTAEERADIRASLGWGDDFVLLHNSSLGWNKNVEGMLDAMLALMDEIPRLRLVIKGMDALYTSGAVIDRVRAQLTPEVRERLMSRVTYIGESLGMGEVARLYQGADAYVCPYLAEGFNMPALESAACGVPVICTAGGSADDFMTGDFALKVSSKTQVHRESGGMILQPSFENYVAQIRRIVRDEHFRARAREAGPAFVAKGWTWRHAADQLLRVGGLIS